MEHTEQKIEEDGQASGRRHEEGHGHDDKHEHDDGHDHNSEHAHDGESAGWKSHWDLLLALVVLAVILVLEYGFGTKLPRLASLIINGAVYLLAGRSVLRLAFRKAIRGDFFNEFVLMCIATIGAFLIGEYEEGVAVMVFYQIGEWFQDAAVNRSRRSIKALLDVRPDKVVVARPEGEQEVDGADVSVGETIVVRPGEKVALDGELLSDNGSFNTAALTGESKPDTKNKGDVVLAGMINLTTPVQIKVSTKFADSKLSRILEMVQDATARKSQTQLFISRFAKVYTPIVFFLALAVCLAPYFLVKDYLFYTWFYRALVFLVVSCPCGLVVSIPLAYFGGIGLASKNGILFKGGNFLDVMTQVNLVVMDKTGTLTKGVFKVQQVVADRISNEELVRNAAALERNSTHPVALAVVAYAAGAADEKALEVEEIAGHGLSGTFEGKKLLAGNLKLLRKFDVALPKELEAVTDTLVAVAIDGKYAGYITIADEIKEDAPDAIKELQRLGVGTVMLSGDKQAVVDKVASALGITEAYGDLLPEGKVEKVQALKDAGKRVAFVGDGVNDAPVVALADAGIAMGGLGSDATIETADVVIQNDQPSKIAAAIKAGRITKRIVWQNITIALLVKVAVLVLATEGAANLWEAVIADVGVALLAIVNAVRIQRARI